MQKVACLALIMLFAGLPGPGAECGTPQSFEPHAARVCGRVIAEMTPQRFVYPLSGFPLYAFTLAQSRAIRKLQHESFERCTQKEPSIYDVKELRTCGDYLWKLYQLIPKLPRTGRTKTDKKGFYCFHDLMPGQQYQLVGIVAGELDFTVVTGITPPLKPRQRIELNLSANDPWDAPVDVRER